MISNAKNTQEFMNQLMKSDNANEIYRLRQSISDEDFEARRQGFYEAVIDPKYRLDDRSFEVYYGPDPNACREILVFIMKIKVFKTYAYPFKTSDSKSIYFEDLWYTFNKLDAKNQQSMLMLALDAIIKGTERDIVTFGHVASHAKAARANQDWLDKVRA